MERQTELARQVQTDLLPPGDTAFENLDFAAECVPAWQVWGDYYDVFSGCACQRVDGGNERA